MKELKYQYKNEPFNWTFIDGVLVGIVATGIFAMILGLL